MYARRQRRVQSASTNAQIQILYELVCLDTLQWMIGYFNGNAVVDGLWHHENCAFALSRICLLPINIEVSAVPRRYLNAKPMKVYPL